MNRNTWHSLHEARSEIYSKLQTNLFKFSQLNMPLFSIWQKTAEIHSISASLTCAGVLVFTFWIHLFPKPRQLWPCRLTPPLIFLFFLCPKNTDWSPSARCHLVHQHRIAKIIHPYTLTDPFLPLGALHLGSQTRIYCYESLWRQTFPVGLN